MDENINITRCQLLANSFHLFMASAKAALYPFLTFYLRSLGISATQTGIVVAAKSFIPLITSPLWLLCMCRYRNKRGLLMQSIFVTMAAMSLLSLVPTTQNPEQFCLPMNISTLAVTSSATSPSNVTMDSISHKHLQATSTDSPISAKTSASKAPSSTTAFTPSSTVSVTPAHTHRPVTTPAMGTVAPVSNPPTPSVDTGSGEYDQVIAYVMSLPPEKLEEMGLSDLLQTSDPAEVAEILRKAAASLNLPPITVTGAEGKPGGAGPSTQDSAHAIYLSLSPHLKQFLAEHGITEDMVGELSPDLVQSVLDDLKNSENSRRRRRTVVMSMIESVNEHVSKFQEMLIQYNHMAFILVIAIVVLGDILSCSVEKLADTMWFDFTDGVDMLEKYGAHRSWAYLGWIFVPVLLSGFVDYTDCYLLGGINHFALHFFTFGGLMGLAFIWAFMFPTLPEKKRGVQRQGSLCKGLTILCSDLRGASFVVSILVLGVATAGMDNFLLWRVQDLGGSESTLGGAVSLGAFTGLVVHFLLRWIVYKVGNAGAVVLALLALALRLVAYAYMRSAWVVLAVGALHGLSNTLLLGAVETYPDFKVNPYIMDRSAKSLASALYMGLAYPVGSILSGAMYDSVPDTGTPGDSATASLLVGMGGSALGGSALGLRYFYFGCAATAVGWALLFALVQRCARRSKRMRYARLLQAEDDQDSDEGSTGEEDWLQTALKHEK